jgi:tetratricopeptide (TPR) repeat protein
MAVTGVQPAAAARGAAAVTPAEVGNEVADVPLDLTGTGIAATEVYLTEGILAFEEGRHAAAAALFTAAVKADSNNGTALHWLGVTDLLLGRAAVAVGALKAALAARGSPEAGRWRVTADLGAAQLAAGDLRAAVRTLGAAARQRPDDAPTLWRYGTALRRSGQEEAGERAQARARELGVELAAVITAGPNQPSAPEREPPLAPPPFPGGPLDVSLPLPRWEGRMTLEAGYDSNPGLLPADATFLPLTGSHPAGTATDGGADLDLRLEAHPFYSQGGWHLGLGVVGNRSAYRHQGDLDLSLAGGFAQLAWGKDPRGYLAGPLGAMRVPEGDGRLGLLLQAAETWTRLGADDYLRLAACAASLTVRGTANTATRIDLGASQLRFAGDGSGDLRRSGSELWLGLSESLFAGGRGGYLRLALGGGERRAGGSFAHRFLEVTVEAGAPPVAGWTLFLQAGRRQERFDHPQSNFTQPGGPTRDDASWRGAIAATRMLGQHLAGTVRLSYLRRDSNVELPGHLPLFAYRRTTAGLGVSWLF